MSSHRRTVGFADSTSVERRRHTETKASGNILRSERPGTGSMVYQPASRKNAALTLTPISPTRERCSRTAQCSATWATGRTYALRWVCPCPWVTNAMKRLLGSSSFGSPMLLQFHSLWRFICISGRSPGSPGAAGWKRYSRLSAVPAMSDRPGMRYPVRAKNLVGSPAVKGCLTRRQTTTGSFVE